MKHKFREFRPERTCEKRYIDYHSYKKSLQIDFQRRCAYCNLRDDAITTHFEIDHYVPRSVFKDTWPELDNMYDNLIYACKKCNREKGNQYEGNIAQKEIINELFYDPVLVDYNDIFYRGELGEICSDDKKGSGMINKLKLYRPIHNLAWICEQLKLTIDKLKPMSVEDQRVGNIRSELLEYYSELRDLFIANYNSNIEDIMLD